MSRLVARGWTLSLTMVASALISASGNAQDVKELRRRLDAVVATRDQATKAFVADQTARAKSRVFPDTVRLAGGAISVATTHELLPLVREGSTLADSLIRERLGGLVSAIPATMVTVRKDTTPREKPLLVFTNVTKGREDDGVLFAPMVSELSRLLRGRAQQQLFATRPTLARWLPTLLPMDTATAETWRSARLELSTSPTKISHRCFDGDIGACKVVFGLVAEPDPITAWYDSAARRVIIDNVATWGQLARGSVVRCRGGRDDACIALLRTSPVLGRYSEPPSTTGLRSALVEQAIADGHRGSVGAFLEQDQPVTDALSAAAKEPLDSLLAHWQRHVHDNAIQSEAFTPGIALLSIGWILAMGGLATRSSRWR